LALDDDGLKADRAVAAARAFHPGSYSSKRFAVGIPRSSLVEIDCQLELDRLLHR
jgi:hypothetical protein